MGALVEKDSIKYWLSNNHVLAGDGKLPTGDASIQPGLIDVGCDQGTGNVVGNLSEYVPYDFSGTNTVDAAIAKIVVDQVDTSGEVLEVGVPSTDPLAAKLGLAVRKSGRTTGLTSGTIGAVDVSVNVQFSDKCGRGGGSTALFVNQFRVDSASFSAGGDSGSVIFENNGSGNPRAVGLLFAGSSSSTWANPMAGEDGVLQAFGVTMVGVAGATGSIMGTVTASGGGAIAGATVTVVDTGQFATAAADGIYKITGVSAGLHDVTADAVGYISETKEVDVPDGGSVTADFTLSPVPTGDISGFVTSSADGSLIGGATVTVEDTGESDITDGSGAYTITGVSTGTHDVTASAAGFVSDTQSVNVPDGGFVAQDFVLDPATAATQAIVECITYDTKGGPGGDKHLLATIRVIDNLDSPVSGAGVSIDVTLGGIPFSTISGTTDTAGDVTFQFTNAPDGTYATDVTDISAAGLSFDASEPANSHDKGTDAVPDADCGAPAAGTITKVIPPAAGQLRAAIAVKRRNEAAFFARGKQVVGVGVGSDNGEAVIEVYLASPASDVLANLPKRIEGVGVRAIVTGIVVAGGWGVQHPGGLASGSACQQ